MNGWALPWAHGIGWTLIYALVIWGASVAGSLLVERLPPGRATDAAQIARQLMPIVSAFVIGMRVQAWWWLVGPPLAIILLHLAYPLYGFVAAPPLNRKSMGFGLTLAAAGVSASALLTTIAAAAGIWLGKS